MSRLNDGLLAVVPALSLCAASAYGQDAVPGEQTPAAVEPAQPPTPTAEDTVQKESLLRAKSLFRQGVAVYKAGDLARAADYFRRSRLEYASAQNTVNEALCLDSLGRHDEALELYEQAIARHSDELADDDRTAIAESMAVLRKKVGELEISSNVTGSVLIGSRLRGQLPLPSALRVLPGRHVVRVVQDGYMPFEATVEIVAQQRQSLDAKLAPLAAAGGLRVETASEPGASVLVDSAQMGPAPWEGRLAPGPHVVQVRSEDRVSMPVQVMVIQGQTVLSTLRLQPAASPVTIRVTPATARLVLEGVSLGQGSWAGWLPVGDHRLRAEEEGYFTEDRTLSLRAGGGEQNLEVRLPIDSEHPRWPRPPKGKLWLSPWIGGALGPSLRSSAEQVCPSSCAADPPVFGFLAGVRVGYELPFPLSFELTAGFLSVQRRITRTLSSTFPAGSSNATVNYELDDILRLRGPMFGGGASYGLGPFAGATLRTRLTMGMLLASSYDVMSGDASTQVDTREVSVVGQGGATTSRPLFVMPEIVVETRVGQWDVGGGVGMLFIPSEGPDTAHEELVVYSNDCGPTQPGSAACAPAYGGISNARAYGPLWLLVPQVSARMVF